MFFKVVKKLIYTFLWILYPLTYFVKRNKNIWVFGSNFNRYNDNSKYLFEYASENCKNVKSIWITGDKKLVKQLRTAGYLAEWRYGFKGQYTAAKAGVYIYCHGFTDINLWLKKGAFKLNLWHGVGLKKVGIDISSGPLNKIRHPKGLFQIVYARLHSPQLFDKSFYLLATSKIVKANYSRSFEIPLEKCFIAGYPRLKPFYTETKPPEKWSTYNDIVLYMPTFRDGNTSFLSEAIPDPAALNKLCKTRNILFVFKLHPITHQSETKIFEGYSNLELMDHGLDVYPLLKHTTSLLTDYSSVFVDYAILNKNILIYTYDLEEYKVDSRDFYFDLDELTSGKKLTSFNQLLSALSEIEKNAVPNNKIIDIFWEKDSKYASRDITNWILKKND